MFYKKHLFISLIILISLIPLLDLLKPGLPLTHDGQDHVVRVANFYQNLSEGNIIPRWAANLNWGYGHPILEFLYPLPSYLASLFHLFGFSLIDSLKIVFGVGVVFSGIFMYLWLREFLGKEASLLGAVLYMIAPYRLVDLYVRGDIGEHLAFVFVPLVFYFLLKLSKKTKKYYLVGGTISLAFLILSHNAISLMFMPLILIYAVYLILQSKDRRVLSINYSLLILLGFGMSAFFWIPGLLEGKYTLRNIVTAGSYFTRFVNFTDLLYGPWSYGGSGQFTVQIGIVNWLALLSTPIAAFYLHRKRNKNYLLVLAFLFYSLISIFFMLKQSNSIWTRIMILQNFQFPWRFLGVTVFTTAALSGFLVQGFPKKIRLFLALILLIITLGLSKDYWYANGYLNKTDSFFTGIYSGTTDTGESAPIWSVRFMEKRPKARIEVIGGRAQMQELRRSSTNRVYKITAYEKARFRENTLYFPGWTVLADGKKSDVEFQDPQNRGLITFFVDKGEHLVEAKYQETKIRLVSDLISTSSLIIILFYSILNLSSLWRAYR